ncbi:shikimate kinase [Enhygromyxa salina]|nr:shikimate kinase [Enhygromyxa salina]
MPEHRVLIVGNSGAGKSTLARRLASDRAAHHLDLDLFAWQPTEPPERTPLDEADRQIRRALANHPRWVVEGCYADLVGLLAAEADELIFLDLPVAVCEAHAQARPWEPHKYATKDEQDRKLPMLLDWIAAYPTREGPLGRPAHEALFEAFQGTRQRITAAP